MICLKKGGKNSSHFKGMKTIASGVDAINMWKKLLKKYSTPKQLDFVRHLTSSSIITCGYTHYALEQYDNDSTNLVYIFNQVCGFAPRM